MSDQWAHFEDPADAKGYALIPNVVMRSPLISLQAKSLYGLLKSYAWQDASTYPGVKTLCGAAGVSKDTLGKYLKELVEARLIAVKRRGQGMTNLYIFKSIRDSRILDGDTGSHQEGDTGSGLDGDPSSHNEDSVNEDSEDNSTEGGASPKTESLANHTMKAIYQAMKEAKFTITKKDYGQQVGRVQWMLDNMEPTDAELDELPIVYVRAFKIRGPATDAVYALNEVRRQPAREEVLAESNLPSFYEKQTASVDKPRSPIWYASVYDADFSEVQAWIDEGLTHSRIERRLDARGAA